MVVGVGSESDTRRRSRNQVQKPELEEFGGDLASIIGAFGTLVGYPFIVRPLTSLTGHCWGCEHEKSAENNIVWTANPPDNHRERREGSTEREGKREGNSRRDRRATKRLSRNGIEAPRADWRFAQETLWGCNRAVMMV